MIAFTSRSRRTEAGRGSLVALGFVAALAQSLLLREAMATLGGSELAWGMILVLWLIGAAAGAGLGARFATRRSIARWSPAAIAVLTLAGTALLRAGPALAGSRGGALGSAGPMLLAWTIALLPPAFWVGFGFASFGRILDRPETAYGLECLGAVGGGLAFTFLLAPWGSPVIAGATLGLGIAASVRPRWDAALLGCLLGFAAGVASTNWAARLTWASAHSGARWDRTLETRFGRIEFSRGPDRAIYSDGRLVGSLPPDPYLVLPRSTLLPLLHPDPKTILAVGGLTTGAVTGLDRTGTRLTVVEEDAALVRTLTSEISPTLADLFRQPRVTLHTGAVAKALPDAEAIDLIVLDDGPPLTIRANRTRTVEFFRRCRRSMADDGVIVVNSGVDATYLGGHAGRLLAIQWATLRAVFPKTAVVAGTPVLLVGGLDHSDLPVSPSVLAERWHARRRPGPPGFGAMIPFLVDRQRSAELEGQLGAMAAPVNTAARPAAVLPSMALAEGLRLPGLLPLLDALGRRPGRWIAWVAVGGTLWMAALGLGRRRRRTGPAFAVGFASMTWYLLLLGAWQATRGAVYSEIGALTAVVMGGMVAGAALSRRWPHPERALVGLFPVAVILSIAVGTPLTRSRPILVIPLELLGAGLLTGLAFAGTARLAGRRSGTGAAFSADEAGAGFAALLVGVLIVPTAGILPACGIAALLCTAAMLSIRRPVD